MTKTLWETLKPLEAKANGLKLQLAAVEKQMRSAVDAWTKGGVPNGSSPGPATKSEKKAKPAGVDNLRGRVRDLLRRNGGTSYTAAKVATALGLAKGAHRAIRKALQNMTADGELKRVDDGVYQAKKTK